MDISTLRLFIEVMRQRSFTEVANARRIAPSSVSRAITGLENELGVRLFQRNTRKLAPTESGLIYFERIAPMVDELESAGQMASDINEEPRGTLRVSAPIVYGQMYIVPLLPGLHEKYPSLTIELLLTDAYQDLIGEHLDVAIRLGSLQDSNYVARRLSDMRFFICASPTYLERHGKPKIPKEVADHECLLFPRQGYNLNWLFRNTAGEIEEITIRGRCLLSNSEAIRQCASSGMGLALLPDWLIEPDIQSGALVKLLDDFEVTATDYDSAVWILRPSREYLPLKVSLFIEYLNKCIASSSAVSR